MDRLRIAIADDERAERHSLETMLRAMGHDVVVAAEGGAALIEQCRLIKPDVVITDNLMPDINGADAAAEIYARCPVPIILLSAYCDRELVLDAEQKHVLLYLVKPISRDHLEAALARCMIEQGDSQDEDSVTEMREPVTAASAPGRRPPRATARVPRRPR